MPEITRFGPGKVSNNTGGDGVTWFDIDIADDADRQWLMAWQEISEQTRTALLEPVRFSHYKQVPDGTLLSIRTLRPGPTEDLTDLADLKLLIGPIRAITVRSGTVAVVDELRQNLSSDRSLVTAMDLLGFMVSGMTNRMEPVISDLTQDKERGIRLVFAEVSDDAKRDLDRSELTALIGADGFFSSATEAVTAFSQKTSDAKANE
jgi:Mg2+ and Co2+ transporter CorA